MSFCKDCIKGVRLEGTPKGKVEKINGVDTYVALPEIDFPKDKAILFLADVYGMQSPNAQLLADDFALNGFAVYAPDYLNGDPIPLEEMQKGTFDIMKWFQSHGTEQTTAPLMKVIEGLKEKGVTKFGATGYCFGGRYVFNLAFENNIHVAVVAHPSLLKFPDDLEKYLSSSKAPLLMNSCTTDSQFPIDKQALADQILGDGKFAPGYVREYWEGCTHGFSVRGDMKDPKVKAGKEGAFKASVEFFIKHL